MRHRTGHIPEGVGTSLPATTAAVLTSNLKGLGPLVVAPWLEAVRSTAWAITAAKDVSGASAVCQQTRCATGTNCRNADTDLGQ